MSANSIFFAVIYFFSGVFPSETGKAYTLTVKIIGLESNTGQIICNLHNDNSTFPKEHLYRKLVKTQSGNTKIVFTGLEKGEYAVTVIYDKNSNNKMDFNFLHIPTEITGASNNAKGFFGPPKFSDAKFLIYQNTTISINMNYYE